MQQEVQSMGPNRILIIEDNISVLASYLQILESIDLDFVPLVAPTYEMAKNIIASESIDLVILDLCLPDALATDILPELRRDFPEIPIFIVTGRIEELDFDKADQFDVTHIFPKPIYVEAFSQAIRSSLGGLKDYL